MENSFCSCVIRRLIIIIVSILFAISIGIIFALGLIPAFASILPFTAALGLIIAIAALISSLSARNNCCARSCDRCLGIFAALGGLLLLLLSLIGIAFGIPEAGLFGAIFVGFLVFFFALSIISFAALILCLVSRNGCSCD